MNIETITLKNFKIHKKISLSFLKTTNAIIGSNGTGKTNVINAISLFSNTTSFKNKLNKELITNNAKFSKIDLQIKNKKTTKILSLIITNNKKQFKINNLNVESKKIIGLVQTVTFTPEIFHNFISFPKERRNFIDNYATQLKPIFHVILENFTKILKERNQILKNKKPNLKLLQVLDIKMSETMSIIIKTRHDFVANINKYFIKISNQLLSKKIKIGYEPFVSYQTSQSDQVNIILKILETNKISDIESQYTRLTTNLDNLFFLENDKNITKQLSQGQKRMAFLALILSTLLVLKESYSTPILLLDDVLSELDTDKKIKFIKLINSNMQVILTNTTPIDAEKIITL